MALTTKLGNSPIPGLSIYIMYVKEIIIHVLRCNIAKSTTGVMKDTRKINEKMVPSTKIASTCSYLKRTFLPNLACLAMKEIKGLKRKLSLGPKQNLLRR